MLRHRPTAWLLLATALAGGCMEKEDKVTNGQPETRAGVKPQPQPMMAAVMHGTPADVRALAGKGAVLDERRPENDATPMIFAAAVDQWPMVETLIEHGADIWAFDRFGQTAGSYATDSRIVPGSAEDAARLRVIGKLKAMGYPYPPPEPEHILEMAKAGEWPPRGAHRP